MAVYQVLYFILAVSGLIGGTIAWDDLRSPKGKSNRKVAPETK